MKQTLGSDLPFGQTATSLPGINRSKTRLIPYNQPREDNPTLNKPPWENAPMQTENTNNLSRRTLPKFAPSLPKLNPQPTASTEDNIMDNDSRVKLQNFLNDSRPQSETSNGQPLPLPPSRSIEKSNRFFQSMELENATMSKCRELEKKFNDLKINLEQKITKIMDENPQKIHDAFNQIENKELTLWQDNSKKHQNVDIVMHNFREQYKRDQEKVIHIMTELQKKIDNIEFKNNGLELGIQGLNKMMKVTNNSGQLAIGYSENDQINGSYQTVVSSLQTELQLLREAFQKDKASKDIFVKEIANQYHNVHQVVFKSDNENFDRFSKQKEDFVKELNLIRQHLIKLEETRAEKYLNENEYVRTLIAKIQRELSDEVSKRFSQNFDMKTWLDEKVYFIKEDIQKERKEFLQEHTQFIKQTQESIMSLNEIIKNTKSQLEMNIISTQASSTENASNLSKALDSLREAAFIKINMAEINLNENRQQLLKNTQMLQEYMNKTNENLSNFDSNIQDRHNNLELKLNKNLGDLEKKLQFVENKEDSWRREYEEKNKVLFIEIHNTLKGLKHDVQLDRNEFKLQAGKLDEKLNDNYKFNEKLIQHLEGKIETHAKDFEFKIKNTAIEWDNNLQAFITKTTEDISNKSIATLEIFDKTLKSNLEKNNFEMKGLVEEKSNSILKQIEFVQKVTEEKAGECLVDAMNFSRSEIKEVNKSISAINQALNEADDNIKKELRKFIEDHEKSHKAYSHGIEQKISGAFDQLKSYSNDAAIESRELVKNYCNEIIKNHETKINFQFEENQRQAALNKTVENIEFEKKIQGLRDETELKFQEAQKRMESFHDNLHEHQETQKKMLIETITQKNEQAKALARALFNEESAERMKSEENILKMIKSNMDGLEHLFSGLINALKLDLEAEINDKHEQVQKKFKETEDWVKKELSSIQNIAENEMIEREAADYLQTVYIQLYGQEFTQYVHENHHMMKEFEKQVFDQFDYLDNTLKSNVDTINKNMNDQKNELIEKIETNVQKINNNIELLKQELEKKRKQDNDDFLKKLNEIDKWYESEIKLTNDHIMATSQELQVSVASLWLTQKMYNQLIDEEQSNQNEIIRKRFAKNKIQITALQTRIEQNENIFDTFEDKTDKNFKIAEKTLQGLLQFTNKLDSQIYMESVLNRVILKELEDKLILEVENINDHLEFANEDLGKKMNQGLIILEKKIIDDFFPTQLVKINQALQELNEATEKQFNQMSDSGKKNTSNVEEKLNELDAKINNVSLSSKQGLQDHDTALDVLAKNDVNLEQECFILRAFIRSQGLSIQSEVQDNLLNILELIADLNGKAGGAAQGDSVTSEILIKEQINSNMLKTNENIRLLELSLRKDTSDLQEDLQKLKITLQDALLKQNMTEEEFKKLKEQEEADKIKREQEKEELKKKLEEELLLKKKKQEEEEELARKKKQEEEELAQKKKQEEEELAKKKKQEEDELANQNLNEEELAQKKKQEEEELARKKKQEEEEELAKKKKLEEEELARKKKQEEEEEAKKKKLEEEEEARKKKIEEEGGSIPDDQKRQEELKLLKEEIKKELELEKNNNPENQEALLKEVEKIRDELNIKQLNEDLQNVKTENEKLKELINELKEKIEEGGPIQRGSDPYKQDDNNENNQKIENTLKKLDSIDIDAIKKDIEKFKAMMDELQKDKAERDKLSKDLNGKIDQMTNNINSFENGLKNELNKNSKANLQSFDAVNNQLKKLLDGLGTLQTKVET